MLESLMLAKFSPTLPWWMTWLPMLAVLGLLAGSAIRAPLKYRVFYGLCVCAATGLMPHVVSWFVSADDDVSMRIGLTLVVSTPLITGYLCHRHAQRVRRRG